MVFQHGQQQARADAIDGDIIDDIPAGGGIGTIPVILQPACR
jgi:hypothetical protein